MDGKDITNKIYRLSLDDVTDTGGILVLNDIPYPVTCRRGPPTGPVDWIVETVTDPER